MTSGEGLPQEANHVVTRQIKNLWRGQATHKVLNGYWAIRDISITSFICHVTT